MDLRTARGLVDGLDLCALIIGRADVVVYANPAAVEHFGQSPPFAAHRAVLKLAKMARESDEVIEAEVHARAWLGPMRLWSLSDGLVAVTLRPAPPPVSAREVADALRIETPEARLALRVAEGYTNRGIAEKFGLPIGTINSRLWRLYQKLDVKNRAGLAARVANAVNELESADARTGDLLVMYPTPSEY